MSANALDVEIRKYLSLLGNEDKRSLLTMLKELLVIRKTEQPKPGPNSEIDYSKFRFPVSQIKFDRDEINER